MKSNDFSKVTYCNGWKIMEDLDTGICVVEDEQTGYYEFADCFNKAILIAKTFNPVTDDMLRSEVD